SHVAYLWRLDSKTSKPIKCNPSTCWLNLQTKPFPDRIKEVLDLRAKMRATASSREASTCLQFKSHTGEDNVFLLMPHAVIRCSQSRLTFYESAISWIVDLIGKLIKMVIKINFDTLLHRIT